MTLKTVSTAKSHGGVQGVYAHASAATGTEMTFSVFVPPHAPGAKLPVVFGSPHPFQDANLVARWIAEVRKIHFAHRPFTNARRVFNRRPTVRDSSGMPSVALFG